MTPDPAIHVRGPADLIDATPFVLGFHPEHSVVVLGLADDRVAFGARYDLPPPDDDDVLQVAAIAAAQVTPSVAILGYGPAAAVDPAMHGVLQALEAFEVRVREALRVHDGRWWSYFCPGCCPPQGNPCNSSDNMIAVEATYQGQVALPSRAALVAQVAAVDGAARVAMTAATKRALRRLVALGEDVRGDRAVRQAGRAAVCVAEREYRHGRPLTDDEVAWLGVLLVGRDLYEYALDRCDTQPWRVALWTDVLRRVDPQHASAPACLLSYSAWLAGHGVLARVAVDRALEVEPQHPIAVLLDQILGLGIGPHALSAVDTHDRQGRPRRRGVRS